MLKDWISNIFDAKARERKAFEKLAARVISRDQQHEDRMAAIEQLGAVGTDEALFALLRRYDMQAEKEREDRAEKDLLADVLAKKGEALLPALRQHLDRSVNVTLPVMVLRRVVGEAEVVTELLRVLGAEQARLAAWKPVKKVHLIRLLAEHDDERVAPAIARSLADFDETVRFEAAQALAGRHDVASVDALIDRALDPAEDSFRVRGALLAALGTRSADLGERAAALSGRLVDGFAIVDGRVARAG